MKIIIPLISPIGDTLFATPALKALRKGYPQAEIEVIASLDNRDILVENNNIDKLIVTHSKAHLLSTLMELRNNNYDLLVALSTAGSYLSYLINARVKLGYKGDDLGWVYNVEVPDNRNMHAADYALEIARVAGGIPDENPTLEYAIADDDYSLLQKIGGITHFPQIAIHPGGKYFTFKRWPTHKFNELIKTIDRELGTQVVLIGGRDEKELAEEIVDVNYNYYHYPLNLIGDLNLQETATLLKMTDFFIGNDSAPQHIAAAMNTPVISLFGPTDPVNFHPYGTEYEIVRCDVDCSPCFFWLGDLKQYIPSCLPSWIRDSGVKCMDNIRVEDVMEKVMRVATYSPLSGFLA